MPEEACGWKWKFGDMTSVIRRRLPLQSEQRIRGSNSCPKMGKSWVARWSSNQTGLLIATRKRIDTFAEKDLKPGAELERSGGERMGWSRVHMNPHSVSKYVRISSSIKLVVVIIPRRPRAVSGSCRIHRKTKGSKFTGPTQWHVIVAFADVFCLKSDPLWPSEAGWVPVTRGELCQSTWRRCSLYTFGRITNEGKLAELKLCRKLSPVKTIQTFLCSRLDEDQGNHCFAGDCSMQRHG